MVMQELPVESRDPDAGRQIKRKRQSEAVGTEGHTNQGNLQTPQGCLHGGWQEQYSARSAPVKKQQGRKNKASIDIFFKLTLK